MTREGPKFDVIEGGAGANNDLDQRGIQASLEMTGYSRASIQTLLSKVWPKPLINNAAETDESSAD